MHVQFEMIHPFVDGNGRLGRLLMTLLFIKRGCLREPLLFLSTYFERHRDEYYQRLLAVSQRGDWEGWIDFFCRAVKSQADYGIRTANNLNELRNELRRVALDHTSSRVVPAAIDLLFEHPYINSGMLAERLQVSPAGARNTLATLEKLGIVEETTGFKRNRVFCAERILAVIREAENPSLADEQAQLEFE